MSFGFQNQHTLVIKICNEGCRKSCSVIQTRFAVPYILKHKMHVTLKLSWVIITTEKARDWPARALYLLTSIEWLVFLEKKLVVIKIV